MADATAGEQVEVPCYETTIELAMPDGITVSRLARDAAFNCRGVN
jgi:hypothetical protein